MPAPKGNQYALGNNGGRPPYYETTEDLAKKIDEYFEYVLGEKGDTNKDTGLIEWIREPEPVTVTGLTLYLGFCSRQALADYEIKSEVFGYLIKNARLRVQHAYEKKLSGNAVAGPIFALKNMEWYDSQRLIGDPENPVFPTSLELKMPPGMEVTFPSNTDEAPTINEQ